MRKSKYDILSYHVKISAKKDDSLMIILILAYNCSCFNHWRAKYALQQDFTYYKKVACVYGNTALKRTEINFFYLTKVYQQTVEYWLLKKGCFQTIKPHFTYPAI